VADQAGTTLIEVIVTVAIMAIAFVAILGGMATSVLMSDVHRKQATAQTILRDYAEAVQGSQVWAGCGATVATYGPGASGLTVPAPYTASATSVQFWRTDLTPPRFASACAAGPVDTGLQQITLQVTSDRGTESVGVVKRCAGPRGGGANQCP
jgi:Tfp pilus assembly protein PilV